MKILYPGHKYELRQLDENLTTPPGILQFVQREPLHPPVPGTTNQEVCRAMIDRIKVLDAEKPWWGNGDILRNLRMVIQLHETRAYERKREKAGLGKDPEFAAATVHNWVITRHVSVEEIPVGEDGHWIIMKDEASS